MSLASEITTLFVADCYHHSCKHYVEQLIRELDLNGLQVSEPLVGGTKISHFRRSFLSSTYTILHVCVHLWTLLNDPGTKPSIDEQSDKIFCVHFGLSHLQHNSDDEVEKSCRQFYDKFRIHYINERTDLRDFVSHFTFPNEKGLPGAPRMSHGMNEYYVSPPPRLPPRPLTRETLYVSSRNLYLNSNIPENQVIAKLKILHSDMINEIEEQKDGFYPNASGRTCIFGRYVYIKHEDDQLMDISEVTSFIEIKDILYAVLRDVKLITNLKFLKFKVLPELTTCNSVYGLAILSTCDYRTLQSESHDTLENLVFQGKTSALHLDDLQLKQCLEMLIDYFKHICYPQKEDPSLFVLIQRKYLLLVMLLGEVIFRCQDVTDYGRCEDINKKLMLLVSQQTENKTKLEVLGKLQKCFKLSPRDLENIAKLTSDHRPQNSSKKIWKYDDQMHFFLILQQLKQLFQTAEIKILTVLEKWLTKSKRFLRQRSRCSYLCVQLVQRGLAHFLQYMAKDLDHMNLNELCPVVLKVLERFQSEDQRTFQDVVHSVQHLLVCPVKVIRDSVHSLLRLTSEHHAEKLSELVIIIEKILFPLFVINNVIHQIKSNSKEDWIKMSGAFNGFPVYLYIRNPKFVNRLERNKMEFLSEGDLNILRHIRTLQALRHDSIVKLYSYSLYELPQFYIIEQSTIEMCRDLQMYLLNKGSNESFCTHLELFNMLIQAADALVYCHNNNYIHGNITLKHFILTSPGCIKLTDFHLATSLQDTETVNWDREQLQDLPTLYSAPETLRRKKRSKQSDVWMFGCFSNSVLNHGEMIPCDMKLTNKNILDKILMSTFELRWPKFVTMETAKIFKDCFFMKSDNRPSMSRILSELLSIRECSQNEFNGTHSEYPTTLLDPLSTERKGVYQEENWEEKRYNFTSDFIQQNCHHYVKENFNLFRSKLKDVSPQLRESIKNGTLDHVVPFVRVVTKGYQKFTIEVRIPFQLSGNILTSIKTNQRGNPDATLNDLIIQVANIVKSLHESNIVLGEIKADQFFVEELPHGQHCKKKVHLTSFSYLAFASDNSQHNIQVDSARIAPEIRDHKIFTYSGDIYSFAHLLWDLWHARNDSQNTTGEVSVNEHVTLSLNNNNPIKPVQMPKHYFNLVKQCRHQDKRQRPTMDEIIRHFSADRPNAFVENRPNSCGESSISESEPYDDIYEPPCVLNVLNPSRAATTVERSVINRSSTCSELSDGSTTGHHVAVAVSPASCLPGLSEDNTPGTSESGYTSAEPVTGNIVASTRPSINVVSSYNSPCSDTHCYDVARYDVYGYEHIGPRHSVEENTEVQTDDLYDRVDIDKEDTEEDNFSSEDDEIYVIYEELNY